ncbi:TPA: hypothetical protein ACNV18_000736 [Pseudomonas putida]|jgi:hypothetical protein|uniref:Uncharacterized protein n=1 Tax=Pseudomonas putida TaxID=303 RepID=A0A166JV65_PSEPU|nr:MULTISPECIES: hypothetical protein [Pseudomonas]PNB55492.1 hypothetical protein C1X73_22050 [Pseudomonas sp. FW305-130]QPN43563.1 hypothetical protein I5S86_18655 [Priestia aryabhattai]MCE0879814.1 hypothetical protein [Pseudomonas putida]MCE0902203.1 hypothetical protein [Pseudomonas alloputida]MDF3873056.1 hypothetical protein [Pseudomonas putida]
MDAIKSCYHPIDAAILWCDLADHTAEILQVEIAHSGELLKHFPQWPCLHFYVERIYDAIAAGELPATFLGGPITLNDHAERVYWSIRRPDLRAWFALNHPEEKPEFLFPKNIDHLECVSLNAFLAVQAERDFYAREFEKMHQAYDSVVEEMTVYKRHENELTAQLDAAEPAPEASASVHYTIIGALLAITVGKSKSGQVQSIYKNQTAVVQAILSQFPGLHGLSKHTLDRKFALARRHLAQAEQA